MARIVLDGEIQMDPNGMVSATFGVLGQDLLLGDSSIQALPPAAAKTLEDLGLSGLITSSSGIVHLLWAPDGSTDIDLHVDNTLGHLQVKAGLLTLQASGQALITLSYHTKGGVSEGQIRFKDGQVTVNGRIAEKVAATVVYDRPSGRWQSQQLQGRIGQGLVWGRIGLRPDLARPWVELELSAANAALGPAGQDHQQSNSTSGSMDGWIAACGYLNPPMDLIGQCKVKICQVRIGKTSILSRLLDVMRLKEPRDYLFDHLQLDTYILHDKVLIERFDMSGASAAFQGSGHLDLTSDQVDLTLTARSSKRLASAQPTALQALTEGLGSAVVRMVIKGKASDPQITTTPLPVLQEPLRLLGTVR
jgi:hypothetical protein